MKKLNKPLLPLLLLALLPVFSLACNSDRECKKDGRCITTPYLSGWCANEMTHDHSDKKHRDEVILDSHEFASRTCSTDANCKDGYRCELHWGFHKGVCKRRR